MPSKFAITGGIGSGKSAFCRILKERGYPVFSCDAINRALWQDKDYLHGLLERFPSCAAADGIDKKALSALVFSDRNALEALNAYAHPRIYASLQEQMDAAKKPCFAEVPLLFESGMPALFDGVIVILRGREERIRSIVRRDGLTPEQAEARIREQFDYDSPLPPGCFVLRNDGDERALEQKADALLKELKESGRL